MNLLTLPGLLLRVRSWFERALAAPPFDQPREVEAGLRGVRGTVFQGQLHHWDIPLAITNDAGYSAALLADMNTRDVVQMRAILRTMAETDFGRREVLESIPFRRALEQWVRSHASVTVDELLAGVAAGPVPGGRGDANQLVDQLNRRGFHELAGDLWHATR